MMVWAVVCLVQAYFSELHPDEAYYWVYAQNLDWGQFHQPPMIAVFIKIGYWFFENELGVRLMSVLTHILTICIILDLVKPKRPTLLLLMYSGLFLIHAGSLLAVPDSPLIFFSALFLWVLNKYLKKNSWWYALALGAIACALLYSKYHGAALLLFCLIPNFKLFKRLSFYIIPVMAIVGFVPHLHWQAMNDFPSYHFHLFNREMEPWQPIWPIQYILTQVLLLGPVGIFLLVKGWKTNNDAFVRTLKFVLVGLFALFLVLSFRNVIESNWTAMAYIPLMILGGTWLNNASPPRWVIVFAGVSLSLFMVLRVELMTGLIKPDVDLNFKYQYYQQWAQDIQDKADGRPVIFTDSYQLPSLYWFYSGEKSFSFNSALSPGNQYDLYTHQHLFKGDVLFIKKYLDSCAQYIETQGDKVCYSISSEFRSYSHHWFDLDVSKTVSAGQPLTVHLTHSRNHYLSSGIVDEIENNADWKYPPELIVSWVQEKNVALNHNTYLMLRDFSGSAGRMVEIRAPKKPGTYFLVAGIRSIEGFTGRNSYFYRIEVVE